MTGYEALSGLPVVATITTDSGSRALHMAESYETDTRDEGTYYVSTTSATDQSIVFVVVADLERGGVLLQAAANRAGEGEGKTDYMCAPPTPYRTSRPNPCCMLCVLCVLGVGVGACGCSICVHGGFFTKAAPGRAGG